MNPYHSFALWLLLLAATGTPCAAQQPPTMIVVGIEIDASNFPSDNNRLRNTFYNRVMNGLAKNSIGSNGLSSISVIAQVNEGEAIYTATAPVRTVQAFTFELRMLNTLSGEVFATYSEDVKVIRKTSTEAYKAAILELDLSGRSFQDFMEVGKQKIQAYYRSNCSAILNQAERLIAQQAYLQAIGKLQSVPPEASQCSDQITQMIGQAYGAYLEVACANNLLKAKALIANRQFDEGVLALMAIPPGSACQEELGGAVQELKAHRMEIDEMNWDRLLKLHEIEIERSVRQYRFLELLAFLNARSNQYVITGQNAIIPAMP